MQRTTQGRHDVLKGLVAGVIGGIAAAVVMNRFQETWSRLAVGTARSHGAQSLQQGSPQRGLARYLQARGGDDPRDDATERFASVLSHALWDHKLTSREKDIAGTAAHYGFGITAGALYGVAAELAPRVRSAAGLPFGAFIWITSDEGVVPTLGLSKSLTEYPRWIRAYGLVSHLVFGSVAELVRRTVRQVL